MIVYTWCVLFVQQGQTVCSSGVELSQKEAETVAQAKRNAHVNSFCGDALKQAQKAYMYEVVPTEALRGITPKGKGMWGNVCKDKWTRACESSIANWLQKQFHPRAHA